VKCKYLIDTVILIDHLNGISEATQWLSLLKEGEAAISPITFAELFIGVQQDEEDEVYLLIDYYQQLDINFSTARLAAELRRQYRWKLPDAFQAALAIEKQLFLVTRNTKDFLPKKHSFVKVPYK